MKHIDLSGKHGQGMQAIVDLDTPEKINEFTFWCKPHRNTFYACTDINKKRVYLHQLVLGVVPGMVIDHINGNGLDNRRENLRHITSKQNSRNNCKSGVHWDKTRNRWKAAICVDYKTIYLGRFIERDQALQAVMLARVKHFGEFHREQKPDEVEQIIERLLT